MNFSRRTFLGPFAAAVAAPRLLRAETPLAKVGILSDTHVSVDPATVEPLLKAFRRFAAEGVGTVVISGDVCEVGTLAELALVMDAWRTAFPDGKNARGQTVDPVFVWGNHDYHEASYQRHPAQCRRKGRKADFKGDHTMKMNAKRGKAATPHLGEAASPDAASPDAAFPKNVTNAIPDTLSKKRT